MKNTLLPAMNWLHTYSGLLFGWVLFAVFFTRTLTVFDTGPGGWPLWI